MNKSDYKMDNLKNNMIIATLREYIKTQKSVFHPSFSANIYDKILDDIEKILKQDFRFFQYKKIQYQ